MESIIQQKHKDRYRIQFCDENFYRRYQNVFEMWQKRFKSLENVEKLQAWVTVLSCLRRPEDWYGGPRALPLVSPDKNYTHPMTLAEIFADSPVVIPAKVSGSIDVFDFLNRHRIKALPESCFRSLCYMRTGRYPLKLSAGVVSPFELLQIQLRGERIVSMDEDFSAWPERLYSGRDYLGFVLHDLIHADHFFFEPEHRDGQLGFYHYVNSFIADESLLELLKSSVFREGFEYIISDMNSHPLHLFQTLHSLLYKTVGDDATAAEIWQRWIALAADANEAAFVAASNESAFAPESSKKNESVNSFAVLKRINARDFTKKEAEAVEALCRILASCSVER